VNLLSKLVSVEISVYIVITVYSVNIGLVNLVNYFKYHTLIACTQCINPLLLQR